MTCHYIFLKGEIYISLVYLYIQHYMLSILGGLMIATNATCLCEISVTQHKLFNSVPW